jgi:hypothetical protein
VHGELAQLIALAAHGSVWLSGTEPPPQLEAVNSTFEYVRRVAFDLHDSSDGRSWAAADVGGWLNDAREREIERFWLSIPDPRDVDVAGQQVPDRMLVAFAGAGQWSLPGTSEGRSAERWRASWALGDRDAPDRRIWDVAYQGESVESERPPVHPDIAVTESRLLTALGKAGSFARERKEVEGWADSFADARRLASAADPQPPYFPDMLPPRGFSESARRLLATAARSWVFGGMGTWNDLTFDGSEEEAYEEVSAELYDAVLGAFVAAANSELDD